MLVNRNSLRKLSSRLSGSDYFQALCETFFIWSISSLVPILTLWFVGAITDQSKFTSLHGFSHSFGQFFVPTEVFLYVTTIMAPSIAFMIFHWRARRHIGLYNTFFLLFGAMTLGTAVVYALSKASVHLNPKVVTTFAIVSYVLALSAWYGIHVYEKRLTKILSEPKPQSGDAIMRDL